MVTIFKRGGIAVLLFFSLAFLLTGLLGTNVVFAQAHKQQTSLEEAASLSCGSWSIVPSPKGGLFPSLNGVAAVSVSNVWAVGYYSNSSGVPQTLIEHWNGTNWSVVYSPNAGSYSNDLMGVSAISASNA